MANFIAQIFGGGKKKEEAAPPQRQAPTPEPVTAPETQARAKTESRFAGGLKQKEAEEAKIAKKMLLGQ